MPWYFWLILAGVIIGPFDALYVYNKAEKRRRAARRQDEGGGDEER